MHVDLIGCEAIKDEDLAFLKSFPGLRELYLGARRFPMPV